MIFAGGCVTLPEVAFSLVFLSGERRRMKNFDL